MLKGANEMAEKESYDDSFKKYEKKYNEKAIKEQDRIYDDSKSFWEKHSEELRKILALKVTESDVLTEDEKNRLCGKIEKYNKINMEKQVIGDPENRKYRCFWNFRIKGGAVASTFNQLMKDSIKKLCKATQISHSQIFDNWANNLLRVITDDDKIIDNNPTLNQIQEKIDNCDKEKKQLETNRETIEQCKEEILKMISWKHKI